MKPLHCRIFDSRVSTNKQNKEKYCVLWCRVEEMALKQKTLVGGIAKEEIYYKHKAESNFEKFVESYYYFNKVGKTKNDVYKETTREWSKTKNDENKVRDFIKKHENAISEKK